MSQLKGLIALSLSVSLLSASMAFTDTKPGEGQYAMHEDELNGIVPVFTLMGTEKDIEFNLPAGATQFRIAIHPHEGCDDPAHALMHTEFGSADSVDVDEKGIATFKFQVDPNADINSVKIQLIDQVDMLPQSIAKKLYPAIPFIISKLMFYFTGGAAQTQNLDSGKLNELYANFAILPGTFQTGSELADSLEEWGLDKYLNSHMISSLILLTPAWLLDGKFDFTKLTFGHTSSLFLVSATTNEIGSAFKDYAKEMLPQFIDDTNKHWAAPAAAAATISQGLLVFSAMGGTPAMGFAGKIANSLAISDVYLLRNATAEYFDGGDIESNLKTGAAFTLAGGLLFAGASYYGVDLSALRSFMGTFAGNLVEAGSVSFSVSMSSYLGDTLEGMDSLAIKGIDVGANLLVSGLLYYVGGFTAQKGIANNVMGNMRNAFVISAVFNAVFLAKEAVDNHPKFASGLLTVFFPPKLIYDAYQLSSWYFADPQPKYALSASYIEDDNEHDDL